jgi:hypothetical protein
MSEQRALLVHKTLIGTCALAALILLVSFYSVVHGAVDRAARQRLAAADAPAPHAATRAAPAPAANAAALVARIGN